jgi:hypothetical protein|tara:strand:+ start:833 stop:1405 length:573 start_codon:yes stop_codon:yes gene_type:complete
MSNSVDSVLDEVMGGESFYDPLEDKPSVIVPEGEYYAHVKEFTVKEDVVVRGRHLADIYNISFKLATSNSDKMFGEHSGSLFVDKVVRSKGFFRFKNPSDNKLQPNSGGNREFKDVCESLGIKPEEKEVDGRKVYALPVLTPSNCEGMPAIIKIKHEKWTNRDGEEVTSPKAVSVYSWSNGKRDLSDIPF